MCRKICNFIRKINPSILVGLIAIELIIVYALFLIKVLQPIENISIETAGVFGDSFGVVTSIFSALAFAGVIYTNILQRDEINIQKEENKEQKKEIEKNRKEIYKQGFENTYFRLLKLLDDKIDSATFFFVSSQNEKPLHGRHALRKMLHDIRFKYNQSVSLLEAQKRESLRLGRNYPDSAYDDDISLLNSAFNSTEYITNNSIKTYIRVLKNILDFISSSSIEEKKLYINLLKSQMSAIEETFVFYYIIINYDLSLTKLVIDYNLLEHFDHMQTFAPDHSYVFYKIKEQHS